LCSEIITLSTDLISSVLNFKAAFSSISSFAKKSSLLLKILLKEAKYDNSTESGSLQIVFTLPDSPLSSLLMVPRARSDAKRRQTEMIYAEKIKETLLAGR
jgi:hypothetical protein